MYVDMNQEGINLCTAGEESRMADAYFVTRSAAGTQNFCERNFDSGYGSYRKAYGRLVTI